jgi:phage tail protein X
MAAFTEYITNEGDRLDSIAYKAYGDVFAWSEIIAANPTLPLQDVYPAGMRVIIPIREETTTAVLDTQKLPPWKR